MDENQQIEQPQPNEQQLQPIVPQGQDVPMTPYERSIYTQLLVAKLRGQA